MHKIAPRVSPIIFLIIDTENLRENFPPESIKELVDAYLQSLVAAASIAVLMGSAAFLVAFLATEKVPVKRCDEEMVGTTV
jgi:hypothetical protein